MTKVLIITENALFDESAIQSNYPSNASFNQLIFNGSQVPADSTYQFVFVDSLKSGVSDALVQQIQAVLENGGSITFVSSAQDVSTEDNKE